MFGTQRTLWQMMNTENKGSDVVQMMSIKIEEMKAMGDVNKSTNQNEGNGQCQSIKIEKLKAIGVTCHNETRDTSKSDLEFSFIYKKISESGNASLLVLLFAFSMHILIS